MDWGAGVVEASGGVGNVEMRALTAAPWPVCESLFNPMESLVVHEQEVGRRSRLYTFSEDENRDADVVEASVVHGT